MEPPAILVPEEYICLNDLQSESKHFGLFEYPQNRLHERMVRRILHK